MISEENTTSVFRVQVDGLYLHTRMYDAACDRRTTLILRWNTHKSQKIPINFVLLHVMKEGGVVEV